ncbi:hypothetical protein SAICODRAFT_28362 [Saitoella complicata NRRL Y-17804]|uniref:Uncharacterized protein n=1 Tax=Saitoella complicata (strain BCRC 22490 / CBS 7301 / JCM 7358 / NBRC 10748 / NRRL Y-17804) TaxID=698492 RepID=A0A0E9NHY3_SAICN|nr:uncharacterized protein SAICODRAFT_28362 [Saitoella complicata NRRL Y-17804]ODQ56068.1 hypothetical protein SAICODRAFT_28362 [Saitoella complicata NRRL Y-17804]GAO49413.1 hypothetical protein G7K_3563-t1 [Saitoella complicata NRRL Y-17804]
MRKLPWEQKRQKEGPQRPATSRPVKPTAAVCDAVCSDSMIVGSHHDDKYIMVEDELVDIVGIVLRDTHRSEYQRHAIELADIKGKSIERPTVDVPAQKEVLGRSTCNDEDESEDANETRVLLDMLRKPIAEREARICNRPSAIRKPVDPGELEVKTCASAKPGIQCLTKQDCTNTSPSTRQRRGTSPESVRKSPRDWSNMDRLATEATVRHNSQRQQQISSVQTVPRTSMSNVAQETGPVHLAARAQEALPVGLGTDQANNAKPLRNQSAATPGRYGLTSTWKHAPKAYDITAFLFRDAPRLPTPLKPGIKRTTPAVPDKDEGQGGGEKKKKKRSLLDELSWLS